MATTTTPLSTLSASLSSPSSSSSSSSRGPSLRSCPTRLAALVGCAAAALAVGCGEPPMDQTLDPPKTMEPPGMVEMKPDRLTLQGKWTLKPGEETYRCFLLRWNRADGLAIRKIAPKSSPGVHHIGVFTDELRAEKRDQWECEEMGLWGYVFGGGVGTGDLQMPANAARHIDDGTPLILQVHLLNASPATLESVATVDLELAPAGSKTDPVGTWLVGKTSLNLPAMQKTAVDSVCNKHPELANVFAVFPHMHKLGDALDITAGADRATKVLSMPKWDFGDQGTLPVAPSQRIAADVPIQTRCSYNNNTDKAVNFGLHTGDEMCVAVLYYWPETQASGLNICQR
mgnify:CR=1 FL=1